MRIGNVLLTGWDQYFISILKFIPSIYDLCRREMSVTNPFEDPDASYLVLIKDEGQHSLWPVFPDVPDG